MVQEWETIVNWSEYAVGAVVCVNATTIVPLIVEGEIYSLVYPLEYSYL